MPAVWDREPVSFLGSSSHLLGDSGTSSLRLSVSMGSVLFLSLIVVILKGNDLVIPVLLRKEWARWSLHCDCDAINFKY